MKLIHHAMEQVALEAISFQSPEYSNKLLEYFTAILAKSKPAEAAEMREVDDIVELTMKHTGLRLKLLFDTPHPPCVLPPYVNPNHVFLPEMLKGNVLDDYGVIISKLEKETATTFIDLKNCRVGGLYSKIESPMYMSFDYLKKTQMTPREVVAVFLHELGHVFVAYEMAWRTTTCNQIMAAIIKSSQDGGDRHQIILKKAGKIVGDEEAFQELTEIKDGKVITTAVMSTVYRAAASQLKVSNYDQTSFEALADQFSARHGYSRDLVTALVKLGKHGHWPEYSTRGRITAIFFDVFNAFGVPALGVLAILGGLKTGNPFSVHAGSVAIFAGIMYWVCAGDNMRDYTYDDVKVRYQRVREQIVTLLKIKDLDPVRVKEELESIAVIDKAIDEAKEFKTMTRVLMNFFIPANRRAVKSIEMQRQLEELAANDIYLKAAALRAM